MFGVCESRDGYIVIMFLILFLDAHDRPSNKLLPTRRKYNSYIHAIVRLVHYGLRNHRSSRLSNFGGFLGNQKTYNTGSI